MAPNRIFSHTIHTVFICIHSIPNNRINIEFNAAAVTDFIIEFRFVINVCCSECFPYETATARSFFVFLPGNAPSAQTLNWCVPTVVSSSSLEMECALRVYCSSRKCLKRLRDILSLF